MEYSGNRLDEIKNNYLQATTNMWPYLRIRQEEASLQRSAYQDSFLGEFYKDFEPISPRLWKSPDNSKQYEIALRYVLAASLQITDAEAAYVQVHRDQVMVCHVGRLWKRRFRLAIQRRD